MKKRQIASTEIWVSEIGFGGASIGNLYKPCTNENALNVLQECLDIGICYFDTSSEYGHGLSERRIGDCLRQYSKSDYSLSTKVGDLLYARHDKVPQKNKFIDKLPFFIQYDYSYDGVMRAYEDSLQRMGLHRADMILVHDLDPIIHKPAKYKEYFKTFVEGGYRALDELRSQGVIKAIGLGVKQWEVCEEAMKYGSYDCFMLQGNYTLLEQPALTTFLGKCVQENISIIQAGPFGSGILATGPIKGANFHHNEASSEIKDRVHQIQTICTAHNISMTAAALQFPLLHPAIACVLIGSQSATNIRNNVKHLMTDIPQELWDDLKTAGFIDQSAPTYTIKTVTP